MIDTRTDDKRFAALATTGFTQVLGPSVADAKSPPPDKDTSTSWVGPNGPYEVATALHAANAEGGAVTRTLVFANNIGVVTFGQPDPVGPLSVQMAIFTLSVPIRRAMTKSRIRTLYTRPISAPFRWLHPITWAETDLVRHSDPAHWFIRIEPGLRDGHLLQAVDLARQRAERHPPGDGGCRGRPRVARGIRLDRRHPGAASQPADPAGPGRPGRRSRRPIGGKLRVGRPRAGGAAGRNASGQGRHGCGERPSSPHRNSPGCSRTPTLQQGPLPWLCLVVVQVRDGVSVTGQGHGLPDVLRIGDSARPAEELPNPADSVLWAHAFAATAVTTTGNADPTQTGRPPAPTGCRLIAPRRLLPQTTYVACLVPTLAAAALAGLGHPDPEIAAALSAAQPNFAWSLTDDSVELPVYSHWKFTCGDGGDFETLARQMREVPVPPLAPARSTSGWPGQGCPSPRAPGLPSAEP